MPINLTEEQTAQILLDIRKAFSDFKYFDRVEGPLKKFLHDVTNECDLNYEKTKNILEYIPDRDQYKTKDQQEILNKFRVILTAAAILVYAYHPEANEVKYRDISELLRNYPEYAPLQHSTVIDDVKELDYLLNFRNYMAVALLIVPAKSNKLFLLKVLERLEGSNNEYITGSGQKPATTRRLDIYKREGVDNNPMYRRPAPGKMKPPLDPHSKPSKVNSTTLVPSGLKKRKLEEIQESTIPNEDPLENLNLSQSSQVSFSIPSSQEDVTNLFVRSHTYRVIQSSNSEDNKFDAALPSTPSLSRENSLLRYTSEVPDFLVDEETEKKLLEDPYKGSFTKTIVENLLTKKK